MTDPERRRRSLAAALQIAYADALFNPDFRLQDSGLIRMSVKSDRWIRRMAEEAQLIHPFEAQLVREVAGTRIISAGASSYGQPKRRRARYVKAWGNAPG